MRLNRLFNSITLSKFPVNIEEFSKRSRVPLKSLRALVKAGTIHDPLTDDERKGLEFLSKTWANRDLLRAQLATFSLARRKSLMETVDLKTKWEIYAFSRFRNLEPDAKLPIKFVIEEIEDIYRFKLNIFQKRRVYKVRDKVYQLRAKEKSLQKTSDDSGNQIKDDLANHEE